MAPERLRDKKVASPGSDRKVHDDKKRSVVPHRGSETHTKLVAPKSLNGHSSELPDKPPFSQTSQIQPQTPVLQPPLDPPEVSPRKRTTEFVKASEQKKPPAKRRNDGISSIEPVKPMARSSKLPNGTHSPQQQFAQVPVRSFQQCFELLYKHADDFSYDKLISEARAAFAEDQEAQALCCVQQALLLSNWQRLKEEDRAGFFRSLIRGKDKTARDFGSSFKDFSAALKQASRLKQAPGQSPSARHKPDVADRKASAFFKTGKVFSTVLHEPVSTPNNALRPYICRMVVVREFSGSCSCLPIYTYGGKGLAWRGLSEPEAKLHAIIGMRDAMPHLMKGERCPEAKAIVVEPTKGAALESSSRLSFIAVQNVNHGIQVADLGRVADESLHELIRFFREVSIGPRKVDGSNHTIR